MLHKLHQKRLELGYSYDDMAKNLNISKSYYWQIENCKRGLTYLMAVRISKILLLKPDDLFYDEIKSTIKESN